MSEVERVAKCAVLMLAGIEAHCRNEAGLKGVDHADEGKRIRRSLQTFLADPAVRNHLKATGGETQGE